MKKFLIASGVAALAFASIASAQGYAFHTNLTVGSTGPDVSALQSWLITNGFHIPSVEAGTATKGYFGSQTKAALALYQASVGLPNFGFFGPLTQAKLNGGVSTPIVVGCPAGMICTPAPGTVGTPVVGGPTGITTPGIPGIMSVTAGPLSSIVSNVGSLMAPVLTVRVQAQYSDLAVQSLNLDLGSNTAIYNKIFSKLYVTDGTNVLASVPLNSSTVIQSGADYIVGLNAFNFIVPKGTYRDLVIKADLMSSIDSKYLSGGSLYPTGIFANSGITSGVPSTGWGIAIPANGLRAVDGAGVNLNGPTGGFAQALTINSSLVDTAQANISLDYSSPLKNTVPVTDTTNGQYNGLGVLAFDVNAQNDTLHLHEAKVQFVTSGTGQVSAAYLYNGSTLITSASVSNGIADFNNITDGTNGATVAKDTTTTFWVKADVTGVTSGSLSIVASTTGSAGAAPLTIYNSQDGNAIITGSAVGNTLTIANNGPVFTLVGAPTITKSNSSADQQGNSTTTYTATFNVQVQAVGTDVALGLAGSSTPAFGTTTDNMLAIYKNGAKDTLSNYTANSATIVSNYSQPTNTTLSTDGTYFTVSRNQSVTIPVTYSFIVKNAAASPATYAVQLQGINWEAPGAALANVNFMKDQVAWRTPAI